MTKYAPELASAPLSDVTLAVIERIIEERKSAEVRATKAVPLAEHRRPNSDERANKVDHINNNGGTGADYLTARIARDRPDILERMKAGEYRSVRAAALDAGLGT